MQLKLEKLFSDYMIIQRNKEWKIWGQGKNGNGVQVQILGIKKIAEIRDNRWMIVMPALDACSETEIIITSGDEEIFIRNVAIGEVWLAGGQSNMEFALLYDANGSKEMEINHNPDIRLFDYPEVSYEGQLEEGDYSKFGFWRTCNKDEMGYFSAVGYYFAKELESDLKVPIGIISCNWGGTRAAAWIKEEYLEEKGVNEWVIDYQKGLESLDLKAYEKCLMENPHLLRNNHLEDSFTKYMMPERTLQEQQKILRQGEEEREKYPLLHVIGPKSPYRPSGLYHSMLEHILPYTIRGFIFYQGESDDEKSEIYHKVLAKLIQCWRDAWQEELPFLMVQLAPFRKWLESTGEKYPILREKQQQVADTIEEVYIASIMDSGMEWDIHPKNKEPVGKRLALLARSKVYGEKILCEAPYGSKAILSKNNIIIEMENIGEGLDVLGETILGFEVLYNGKSLNEIQAKIEHNNIVLYGEFENKGEYTIRFAYVDYIKVNLYNSAGLPARPFILKIL